MIWSEERVSLDCLWQREQSQPPVTARYIRFYRAATKHVTGVAEENIELTLATFVVLGYRADQFEPVTDYYWTKTCPGFQVSV